MNTINTIIDKYKDYNLFVLNSTGKDSMVVEDLCRKSNHTIKTVFNNTTLDCSDTYKIVNKHKNEWIITTPEEGFYQYIERNKFIPTRFSRNCCSIFKEGNYIKHFDDVEKAIWIMGVRNDESSKRANRQDIEHNPKWGNREWIGLLPIRKWTELDIWLYTIYHNIEINPKYKYGYKRVGCSIACPYANKSTWYLDRYYYPKMFDRWHKILENDFISNGKWCSLNCTLKEYHYNWNGGVVREHPTEEVIKEFMKYQGIENPKIAEQYFDKKCIDCGKRIYNKNTIAMNLKLHGRSINKFQCRKCMMKQAGIDNEKWNKYIKQFKEQGCSLF